MLVGEVLAIPLSLLPVFAPDPVTLAHAVSMGFAGIHIAVHAPLMLPALLGVRAGRRYTVAPYALLYAALGARLYGAPAWVTALLAALFAASLAYVSFSPRGVWGRRPAHGAAAGI